MKKFVVLIDGTKSTDLAVYADCDLFCQAVLLQRESKEHLPRGFRSDVFQLPDQWGSMVGPQEIHDPLILSIIKQCVDKVVDEGKSINLPRRNPLRGLLFTKAYRFDVRSAAYEFTCEIPSERCTLSRYEPGYSEADWTIKFQILGNTIPMASTQNEMNVITKIIHTKMELL